METGRADRYNPAMSSGALGSVVRIGLIAGTLDIAENLIFNAFRHITPAMIFRYIASGLTGRWAFEAGVASILLGVAIHYTIALFWTALYWTASGRMAVLEQRPVASGLVYGGLVYAIMNYAVLPLTRVPHSRVAATLASRVSGVLALLFCIGLTVALLTARARRG